MANYDCEEDVISESTASREEMIRDVLAAPSIWELLRLPPDSGRESLRKGFRKVAMLIHPDKCSHEDATRAFQRIQGLMDDMNRPIAAAAPAAIKIKKPIPMCFNPG